MAGPIRSHALKRRAARKRRGRSWHDQAEAHVSPTDLSASDGGTRIRAAQVLQARMGNAAVQHFVEAAAPRRGETGPELTSNTGDEVTPDTGSGLATGGGGRGSTTITPARAAEDRDEETLNEVATALSNKTEAGSTLPTFGDIKTDLDANSRVTGATLTITETVTLPKWTKYDKQCQRHKDEWDRFSAALKTHEDGHVAIDKKVFTDMHKQLIGLKDTDVDAKVTAIQADAQTKNDEYDTKNGHGTKEGTNIDAGIRCTDKVD